MCLRATPSCARATRSRADSPNLTPSSRPPRTAAAATPPIHTTTRSRRNRSWAARAPRRRSGTARQRRTVSTERVRMACSVAARARSGILLTAAAAVRCPIWTGMRPVCALLTNVTVFDSNMVTFVLVFKCCFVDVVVLYLCDERIANALK